MTAEQTGAELVNLSTYVSLAGSTERTVRKWLAAGRLPDAVKRDGQWWIPADARPTQSGAALAAVPAAELEPVPSRVTLSGALDHLPAYLTLEQASRLLGVTEYAIRAHRDHFQAVALGPRQSLVVPAFRVRQLAGI